MRAIPQILAILLIPLASPTLASETATGNDRFLEMLTEDGTAEITSDLVESNALSDMEPMPSPRFYVVESPDRGMGLLSANGRYWIDGQVFDLWQGKELTSVQAVRDSRQFVDARKLDLHERATFAFGAGTEEVTIFTDPSCPYCQKMLEQAVEISDTSDRYRFSVIELPALGEASLPAVKRLWCSTGPTKAWLKASLQSDTSGLTHNPGCDTGKMVSAFVAADMIGIDAVPMAVLPNGYLQRGLTSSLKEILEEHGS